MGICDNKRYCSKGGRLMELKDCEYLRTELGVLYKGNCLEIMPLLDAKSIDLIATDPPYGISFKSKRNNHQRKIAGDGFEEWKDMLPDMLREFNRLLTQNGVACCFCGGGGKGPVTAIFTLEAVKWLTLIQTVVWRKFIGLGWHYRPSYENILILSKEEKNYNFFDETKACSNVIEGINQNIPQKGEHPTQKPIKLMEKLLHIHSLKDMLVLDPFLGGGTTALACERLGRRWIGIELDEEYLALAKKRILEENKQMKLF